MQRYLEEMQPQHWPTPNLKLPEFQVLSSIRKASENQKKVFEVLKNMVHVWGIHVVSSTFLILTNFLKDLIGIKAVSILSSS